MGLFNHWMFNVYADSREFIEQEQKADSSYYRDFSSLIEKLRAIEEKEGGTSYLPSREDIDDFWEYELGPNRFRKGTSVNGRQR